MSANALLNKSPNEFSESCLFISKYKLERINCPFQVICIAPIRRVLEGDKKQVDKILSWGTGTILYYIEGKLYPHHFFKLLPPKRFVITGIE